MRLSREMKDMVSFAVKKRHEKLEKMRVKELAQKHAKLIQQLRTQTKIKDDAHEKEQKLAQQLKEFGLDLSWSDELEAEGDIVGWEKNDKTQEIVVDMQLQEVADLADFKAKLAREIAKLHVEEVGK